MIDQYLNDLMAQIQSMAKSIEALAQEVRELRLATSPVVAQSSCTEATAAPIEKPDRPRPPIAWGPVARNIRRDGPQDAPYLRLTVIRKSTPGPIVETFPDTPEGLDQAVTRRDELDKLYPSKRVDSRILLTDQTGTVTGRPSEYFTLYRFNGRWALKHMCAGKPIRLINGRSYQDVAELAPFIDPAALVRVKLKAYGDAQATVAASDALRIARRFQDAMETGHTVDSAIKEATKKQPVPNPTPTIEVKSSDAAVERIINYCLNNEVTLAVKVLDYPDMWDKFEMALNRIAAEVSTELATVPIHPTTAKDLQKMQALFLKQVRIIEQRDAIANARENSSTYAA